MEKNQATFDQCKLAVRSILKRERDEARVKGEHIDGSVGTFVYDGCVYLHCETDDGLHVTMELNPANARQLAENLLRRAAALIM